MTAPLQSVEGRSPMRQERLVEELRNECGKLLGRPPQEIASDASFLALGADSLLLLRMSQSVKDRFGIKVPFRRLIDDLSTVQMLAAHLDQSLPPECAELDAQNPETKPIAAGALAAIAEGANQPSRMQDIFAQQLRVITMQLELMRGQMPAVELSRNVGTGAKPRTVNDTATGMNMAEPHAAFVNDIRVNSNGSDEGNPSHDSAIYSRRSDNRQWVYAPSWMRSSVIAKDYACGGSWLLFADEVGVGDEMARQLRSEGGRALVVRSGKEYLRLSSTEWSIDSLNRRHYANLLHDIGAEVPSQVVHLWNFCPPEATEVADEMFARYQSLLFLAQAVNEVGVRMQLAVVSNRMRDVLGAGHIRPGKALLLGPSMSISRDLPALSCRSIDFDTDGEDRRENQAIIRQLRLELASSTSSESVAYAAGQRWLPCFEQVRVPMTGKTLLHENSVYLITGGLGGVGLDLANHLASNYGARLALTGRAASDDRTGLESLRATGAELMVLDADVTSKTDMAAVISQTKNRFGSIHGVIHAEGVTVAGLIAPQSAENLAILRPSVLGTMVLHEIFQEEPLELMVLFSSQASAIGPHSRAECVAASAFLDASAAQAKGPRKYQTVTINWDARRDAEMDTSHMTAQLEQPQNGKPVRAMTTVEAVDAFEIALRTGLSQVLVSSRDLPAINEEYGQGRSDLIATSPMQDDVDAQELGADTSMFEKILSEVQALTPEQVEAAIRNELKIL